MSVIVLPHTPVSGQVVPSVGQLANFTTIRDAFNNTAVQTDVAKTIGVAHTFGANILFTDALYDIGQPGATRPRDLHLSRNIVVGGTAAITGAVTLSSTLAVAGRTDVAATIRSTGLSAPTAGVGVEIAYEAAVPRGYVLCYDRSAAAYMPLQLLASSTKILYNNGNLGLEVATGGQVLIGAAVAGTAPVGAMAFANNCGLWGLNTNGVNTHSLIKLNASNVVEVGESSRALNLGMGGSAVTFTNAATSGTAGALVGYWVVNIGGIDRKIPYYATA